MSNNSKTIALYGEIDVSNINQQKQKSIICQTVLVCLKERKNILIMPNYSPPPNALSQITHHLQTQQKVFF